ncbi:hypothetical protein [Streptomyces sp. Z26]|uniref:hypothetical protein n=1 Tax=Streptomyces sp. Z26 TaxID=2500177 RepID=UPI0019D17357|nr:hypothetical protein [Streptomyces sp. Z26]
MPDPYRLTDVPDPRVPAPVHAAPGPDPAPVPSERAWLRPVLWTVLVVCAAANAVFSGTGASVAAGIGFGLLTLACATALVVHHYRGRRR